MENKAFIVSEPTIDQHKACSGKCKRESGYMVKCSNLKAIGNIPCQSICHFSCTSVAPDLIQHLSFYYCDDCTAGNENLHARFQSETQAAVNKNASSKGSGSGSVEYFKDMAIKLEQQLQQNMKIIAEQNKQNKELAAQVSASQTTISRLQQEAVLRDEHNAELTQRLVNLEKTSNQFNSNPCTSFNYVDARLNKTLRQAETFNATFMPNVATHNTTMNDSINLINWPDYLRQANEADGIEHAILMYERTSIAKPIPFTGDVTKWSTFMSEFIRTSARGHYREFEDVDRLRELIQGEARELFWTELSDPLAESLSLLKRLNDFFGVKGNAVKVALDRITQMSRIEKAHDKEKIKRLYTLIKQYALQCRTSQSESELRSNGTIFILESKMNFEHSRHWRSWAKSNGRSEDVDGIIAYLEEQIRELNLRVTKNRPQIAASVNTTEVSGAQAFPATTSTSNAFESNRNSSNQDRSSRGRGNGRDRKAKYSQCLCFLCKEKHPFFKCPQLIGYDVKKRIETVNQLHICTRCLASDKHKIDDCPNRSFRCYVTGCKVKNKHPLLHGHTADQIPSFTIPSCQIGVDPGQSSSHFAMVPGHAIATNGDTIPITIMFDGGSGISLATRSLYERAQYENRGEYELILRWATKATHTESRATKFNLKFRPQGSQRTITLKGISAVDELDLPEQAQNPDKIKASYPYLNRVPIPSYNRQRPQVLLGLTHASCLANLLSIPGKNQNDPVAALTPLGWVIFGNCSDTARCQAIIEPKSINLICSQSPESEISNDDLLKYIRHYNSVDSIGISHTDASTMSADDQRAATLIDETMKFLPDQERYEVGLLWKNPNCTMPDNYDEAVHRLNMTEKRLAKLKMVEYVDQQFKEQIDKGWLVEVSRENANQFPKRNYVYGFLTFNMNKSPPKPRWVNDTAAKFKGVSLNTMLLKGPDNLVPLPQSMCALREGLIAFQADVKTMFNQVVLKEEDQFSQLTLWRSCDSTIEPKIYRQTRVIFGPTCSPSTTSAVRIKHASNCEKEFPEACDVAINQMYVDDAPDSRDSVPEAAKVASDLITLFARIGWPLVEFQSNSQELLNLLPQSNVSQKMASFGHDDEDFITKVLGIHWKPSKDVYVYRLNDDSIITKCTNEKYEPTKREMLSTVMRIFDPLGQISPFRVRGHMIMQHVWRAGTDWQKRPPPAIAEEFVNWLRDFESVTKLQIPRAYSPVSLKESELTLHLFVDAGAEAYAACVYLHIKHGENVYVRLIAAKARVAPLKYMSIPRLELMSALIGSRLLKSVREWHRRLNIIDYVCWTDSDVSFKWIRSHHLPRTAFSAPRIAEIQELTSADKWRYVPSKLNVADYATKERQMDYSDANHEWFIGPQFLYGPQEKWPKQPSQKQATDQEIAVMLIKPQQYAEPYLAGTLNHIRGKFRSEWLTLIGVVAIALRFADHSLKARPHHRRKGPFTPYEFERAENYVIRQVQKEVFAEEYKQLLGGGSVKVTSQLASLSPYLCRKTMIIRATTRLSTSFPINMRSPPILPNFHEVTDTLVKYYHAMSLHVGDNAIIASLRSRVWIINVKRAVRRCRARCLTCIEKRVKAHIPQQADLPDFRFDIVMHPFYHTGCDLFGPFDTFIGKSRYAKSAWVIIFTCMVTRAVYLEVLEEQSTDHFIIALNKLWARRGPIKHIYSDNGRNFVGAAALIKSDTFQNALLEKRIEWHFTPAYTPQFGGVWERLIKDVKRGLAVSIGKFTVTRTVLEGSLVKIEANVNNRPLTELPISPEDDIPLTPYLLLTGHPNYPITSEESAGSLPPSDEIMKMKSAQKIKAIVQAFRKRFVEEYAPVIAQRTTNREQSKYLLKQGDFVIYMDPTKNPSQWLRGVVDRIYPGKDKRVRVADVKLKSGEIIPRRSVYRLAKLDLRLENNDAEKNKYENAYRILFTQIANRQNRGSCSVTVAQLKSELNTRKLNSMNSRVNCRIFDDSTSVVKGELAEDKAQQPSKAEMREFEDESGDRSIFIRNLPPTIGASEIFTIFAEYGTIQTIKSSSWTGDKPFSCLIVFAEPASAGYATSLSESILISVGERTHTIKIEPVCRPSTLRKSVKKPLIGFIWIKDESGIIHKVLFVTNSAVDKNLKRSPLPVFGNVSGFINSCPRTHRYEFESCEVSLSDGAKAIREIPYALKQRPEGNVGATSSRNIQSAIHVVRNVTRQGEHIQVTLNPDPFESELSASDLRRKLVTKVISGSRKYIAKVRKAREQTRRRRNRC